MRRGFFRGWRWDKWATAGRAEDEMQEPAAGRRRRKEDGKAKRGEAAWGWRNLSRGIGSRPGRDGGRRWVGRWGWGRMLERTGCWRGRWRGRADRMVERKVERKVTMQVPMKVALKAHIRAEGISGAATDEKNRRTNGRPGTSWDQGRCGRL